MNLFRKFLAANARSIREVVPTSGRGVVLIDCMQFEPFYLFGILKTGMVFADLEGLTPLAYPSERSRGKHRQIIRSLCKSVVPVRLRFLQVLLRHLSAIVQQTARVRAMRDILAIEIEGCPIGPYLYDATYLPAAKRLTFKQRVKVAYYLACHYLDRAVLASHPVSLVLVGDPAGRTGMLFALCRSLGIRAINAINVDVLQMHKYFTPSEFDRHYRDVPESALALLGNSPAIDTRIDEYFAARLGGAIQQHDVVRAYASSKVIRTKQQLCQDHGFDPALPLVFVMAHVLTDAPHAYQPTLFQDYEDWVRRTALLLARNRTVNFLVKEHPSVKLYGESGILAGILRDIGLEDRLAQTNLHTRSVLGAADAVVTCGGTIGIEAASFGIPVVLAARPPYAGKGFTSEPATITAYEDLLTARIGELKRLRSQQIRRARQVAYVMFELYDNDAPSLELGKVSYRRGEPFPAEQFYRNLIDASTVPLRQQQLYKKLQQFHASEDPSIINYDKLHSVLSSATDSSLDSSLCGSEDPMWHPSQKNAAAPQLQIATLDSNPL